MASIASSRRGAGAGGEDDDGRPQSLPSILMFNSTGIIGGPEFDSCHKYRQDIFAFKEELAHEVNKLVLEKQRLDNELEQHHRHCSRRRPTVVAAANEERGEEDTDYDDDDDHEEEENSDEVCNSSTIFDDDDNCYNCYYFVITATTPKFILLLCIFCMNLL